MEDAIGLLVLAMGALIAIILGGLGLICTFDLLSSGLSWFTLGPAAGWSMLGALIGGLYGTVKGLKSSGKGDDLRALCFGVGVLVTALAAIGLASPACEKILSR